MYLILADKQNWHDNICGLNLDLIAVSSSESPAFEHCKNGVSKHTVSQVSDRCPLGYLFYKLYT